MVYYTSTPVLTLNTLDGLFFCFVTFLININNISTVRKLKQIETLIDFMFELKFLVYILSKKFRLCKHREIVMERAFFKEDNKSYDG